MGPVPDGVRVDQLTAGWVHDPDTRIGYLRLGGQPDSRYSHTVEAHERRVFVDVDTRRRIIGVEVREAETVEDCWAGAICVLSQARMNP